MMKDELCMIVSSLEQLEALRRKDPLNDLKESEIIYEDHRWWAQIQTGPSG